MCVRTGDKMEGVKAVLKLQIMYHSFNYVTVYASILNNVLDKQKGNTGIGAGYTEILSSVHTFFYKSKIASK